MAITQHGTECACYICSDPSKLTERLLEYGHRLIAGTPPIQEPPWGTMSVPLSQRFDHGRWASDPVLRDVEWFGADFGRAAAVVHLGALPDQSESDRLRADLAEAIERRDTANRAISFLTEENRRLAEQNRAYKGLLDYKNLPLSYGWHWMADDVDPVTVGLKPPPDSKAFPARALAAHGQQIGLRTPRG